MQRAECRQGVSVNPIVHPIAHPIAWPRIFPTPLLIRVATQDTLTPTDIPIRALEAANEPKKLAILPGGHFDAYVDGFPHSSGHATAWFKEHLGG